MKTRDTGSGKGLEANVALLGAKLGLNVDRQVRVGRRLWGAERRIDVVLTEPGLRRSLGIECKFQGVAGTTEEKIPATIRDIEAWPIAGIVVYDGAGFSPNMVSYLLSTGKAVSLDDLEPWLRLFFAISS